MGRVGSIDKEYNARPVMSNTFWFQLSFDWNGHWKWWRWCVCPQSSKRKHDLLWIHDKWACTLAPFEYLWKWKRFKISLIISSWHDTLAFILVVLWIQYIWNLMKPTYFYSIFSHSLTPYQMLTSNVKLRDSNKFKVRHVPHQMIDYLGISWLIHRIWAYPSIANK